MSDIEGGGSGKSRDVVAQPDAINARAVVPSVTVVTRSYFSTQHLWAARHLAHLAAEYEGKNASRAPMASIQHRVYVITAVSEAVAFLEATVNEVLQDAHDDHHSYVGTLGVKRIAALRAYWATLNRGQSYVLKKYTKALALCGANPLSDTDPRHENAAALVDLRNALTHYRPASVSTSDPHPLDAKLRGRFAPNLLRDSNPQGPFYPDHALGAGCAQWAVNTATSFADHFAQEMSLTLNYQVVTWLREPPNAFEVPPCLGPLSS